LTRAFQYSGARSVLASMWSVSDPSTADLMKRFYVHLEKGTTKDEALRAAQIEMVRGPGPTVGGQQREIGARKGRVASAGSHPFAWAAFALVGDWR
jgi:CHAT domain-containing protein